MRALILFVILLGSSGLSAAPPATSWLNRLQEIGYLKGMSPAQQRRCTGEMRKIGTPWATSCHRVVQADAEELAEGAFADTFRLAAPLLTASGAASQAPRTESTPRGFLVYTDTGHAIDLYEPGVIKDKYAAWERASLLFQIIANIRLRKAGSPERFYRVYFANDQLFVLLTPQMYDVIENSRLEPEHKPEPLPDELR